MNSRLPFNAELEPFPLCIFHYRFEPECKSLCIHTGDLTNQHTYLNGTCTGMARYLVRDAIKNRLSNA
jgi:hypothetical protein